MITVVYYYTGTCDPPCVNGACVSDDTCSCSNGFEGELCELEGTVITS